MKYYGENIKTYRKEKNLKQEELAQQLGISSNMLGKIERGERKPNKEVQEKFFYISGIKYEDEIAKEIEIKLENYLLDYLASTDISKEESLNLILYFRGLNSEEIIANILYEIKRIPPNEKDSIKYYIRNILLLLYDFYQENKKQCNLLYKNVHIFILDNVQFIMDLLSRIESSIFIRSKIPLYINTIPLDTHSKTDEYLSNIQINKYKFACIVQDNIMYPKFEKGNIIIVLEDDKYSNGDDVLVSINNETPIIRKILYKENLIILQTYNDINKTEIYPKEEVKILGKIIEVRYNNS